MIELYELNPHKMTTPQEKAQCVSWFMETKSDVQTQRNYRSMEETHHHVLQFVIQFLFVPADISQLCVHFSLCARAHAHRLQRTLQAS